MEQVWGQLIRALLGEPEDIHINIVMQLRMILIVHTFQKEQTRRLITKN